MKNDLFLKSNVRLTLFLCLFTLFSVSAQNIVPSLNTYYSGPYSASNAASAAPVGWSWTLNPTGDVSLEGPGAGTAGRLNAIGHQVQINLGTTVPSEVTYWLNMANTANKTLLVEHSVNETAWTTAATHTQATVPVGGNGNGTFYQTPIPSTAKFIRFRMTVRAGGRMELDGISVIGTGANPTCYPTYTNLCSSDDFINNFSTTGGVTNITNNGTGCNGQTNNYTMYPSQVVTVDPGSSFNVSMQSGASWAQGFRIWVDWNGNGVFTDANEDVYNSGSAATTVFNGVVNVPASATPGPKVMRVRCAYNCVPSSVESCGAACSTYGEAEDYVVMVNAVPYASELVSMTTGANFWCHGETRSVTVRLKNVGTATWYASGSTSCPAPDNNNEVALSYKWNDDPFYDSYSNNRNPLPNNVLPGEEVDIVVNVQSPNGNPVGSNNLSFKLIARECAWFDAAHVSPSINVNALPTAVNAGSNQDICFGGSTQLTGSATAPLAASTSSFTGGAVTINASGNANPYPSTVSVSGLTGNITNIRVFINNLSHTWPTDIDMVLFGPTGAHSIIFTDAIGGSGGISGRNYIFEIGASVLPATGFPASGTYGVVNHGVYNGAGTPSAVSSANLSNFVGTNPNGTWSLYVFDDATGDAGSMGSWSIEITSNEPSPLTYSWSPATGLSNPNIANPVANPSSTETYTLTATSLGCSGTPDDVTITVNPIGTLTGTLSACVGGTSDLSVIGESDWAFLPTGGTITTIGDHERVHVFNASGSFDTPENLPGSQLLVIGAGGGGGANGGGGGGAGGVYYTSSTTIGSGATTVTIGAGGTFHNNFATPPEVGGTTSFGSISAGGGGGGSSRDVGVGGANGAAGTHATGAGGGGSGASGAPRHLGGSGTFNGGNGTAPDASCFSSGGGGGGAGGNGGNGANDLAGNGGLGIQNNITGTNLWYAGGGGGGLTGYPGCGASTATQPGGSPGGSGVGGNGETSSGSANTGSGGGAELVGADGVVIVRYFQPKWTSSNTAVATVDELTGLVTAVASGTTMITYISPEGCVSEGEFTVDAPSVAPTGIDNLHTICNGGTTELEVVGGSLASGANWEWFSGTCGGTGAGTGSTITVAPSSDTDYFVRASLGTNCPASTCVTLEVELPATGTNVSLDGENATCYVNNNGWIDFYNASGRLIASVNSNGQDLGNVVATTYVNGSAYQTSSCTEPTNISFYNAALQRTFVITPDVQPASPVQVRLYLLDAEVAAYQAAALLTTQNPHDDIANIGDLNMSKVSGGAGSGDPMDFCSSGGTAEYVLQTGSGDINSLTFAGFTATSYLQFTINGFSEFFPMNTNNSALPVSLTNFSANCLGENVLVQWTTASEMNASHYTLQSSRDGHTWMHIAEIEAAGTTNQTTSYSYDDINFGALTYYRLVQVDFDGQHEVFGPISANCNIDNSSMTVHPNPTSDNFTVYIQTNESFENAVLELMDMSGRVILSQTTDINTGSTMVNFEGKTLIAGTYMVRVKGQNDKFTPIRVVKM